MKLRNIFNSFASIVVLASITSAQFGTVVDQAPITYSKEAFAREMRSEVEGRVMGFSYVVLKKGQIVQEYSAGKAANAADGNRAYTVTTPTNIGSLAKFLSGTAMLGLMTDPNATTAYDNGLSLNSRLDRKIWTVMPSVWVANNKAGVEQISFRQMLQHRTGFDTDKVGNRTVLGYLQDNNGFLQSQFDDREYANINYVLNGYLLPLYGSPGFKQNLNSRAGYLQFNEAQVDADAKNLAGIAMHNIMKNRIWDKMSPKISPNCDAANTLQNSAAYGYDSKSDAANGSLSSAIDSQGHCGGHGGYYLSTRGLANYVAHAMGSDLIINQEARDLMHTDNMDPKDRLVWSFNWQSNYMNTNFDMPNIAWSNGVAGSYRTVVAKFPMDYYVILTTNSPDLSASQLMQASVNSFAEATKHNFD